MDAAVRYREEARRARERAAVAGAEDDRKAWLHLAECWEVLATAEESVGTDDGLKNLS